MEKQQSPVVIVLEQDQLLEKIREVVRAELSAIPRRMYEKAVYEVPGMVQKPLYKAHEVTEMFQISRQTLHQWVKEGILKPYKIKSRLFFLAADLEKLISTDVFKK